ncbi:MAG: DUF3131 domain-containing protein [Candidatus Geothermarchaeales archaeon]
MRTPRNIETSEKNTWIDWAETAWRYYQPGVGVNPDTLLHYATLTWHKFTDWDLASYILAIIDADKLGIIQDGPDAEDRIDRILDFLKARELTSDQLPYWAYYAESGEPDRSSGPTNPSDSGRLLIALSILKQHRPDLAPTIDHIVYEKHNYTKLVTDPSSSWGSDFYRYYIAQGFKAFGFDTYEAVAKSLGEMDKLSRGPFISIYDEEIPLTWVTSEPIIHGTLELDLNSLFREYAHRVYNAQEKRYYATGRPTAFSEGNYPHTYPYVYEWIVRGDTGETWTIMEPDQMKRLNEASVVYTKAAFGFHAIYATNYTKVLLDTLLGQHQLRTSNGFLEGITEEGEVVNILSDKTNSIIINAARYAQEHSQAKKKNGKGVVYDLPRYAYTLFKVNGSEAVLSKTVELLDSVGAYNVTFVINSDNETELGIIYKATSRFSAEYIPYFWHMQRRSLSEREVYVDEYFKAFRSVFGDYPKGFFDFQPDTYTLLYAREKYEITYAVGYVWDQVNIDFITERGAIPFPYYASRGNHMVPARNGSDNSGVVMLPSFAISPTLRYHFDNNHLIDNWSHLGVANNQNIKYVSHNYPYFTPMWLELDWLYRINSDQLESFFKDVYGDVYSDFSILEVKDYVSLFRDAYSDTPVYHFTYKGSNWSEFPEVVGWSIEWYMDRDYRIARLLRGSKANHVVSFVDYGSQRADKFLSKKAFIDPRKDMTNPDNQIDTSLVFEVDWLWQKEHGDYSLARSSTIPYNGDIIDFPSFYKALNIQSEEEESPPSSYEKEDWIRWATTAWRYFLPGVGVSPTTGLLYPTTTWKWFTEWDLGGYVIAIVDAERIGILPRDGEWGAADRIDKVLSFLENRQLMSDGVPYAWYNADTGEPRSGANATGPSDSGRLLVALHLLKKYHPALASTIDYIVHVKTNYSKVAEHGGAWGPSGSLFYEYYSAQGFRAFGFDTPRLAKALGSIEVVREKEIRGEVVDVYGDMLPVTWMNSEPLLHGVIELELGGLFREYCDRAYKAQERRYQATGKWTAFSEGSFLHPYYYVYEWIVTGLGETWVVRQLGGILISDVSPTVYTKVVFAYHAIYSTEYTQTLLDNLLNFRDQHGRVIETSEGFHEGIHEDTTMEINYFLSDKTNSMIISAARYAIEHTVIIDRSLVSDERADVGSPQTIYFHAARGLDGSDVRSGVIYVNGTGYTVDSSGWISFQDNYEYVTKKTWVVTSIDVGGAIECQQTAPNPSIIWDRVSVTLSAGDERIDVGSNATITWRAFYEYDDTPLVGLVNLNDDTIKSAVGKWHYTTKDINDYNYGLTAFTSNTIQVIFDRVSINLSVPDPRINVGETATIDVNAVYEYDGTIFDGEVVLNDTLTKNTAGRYGYTVQSISGDAHGITIFESNAISVTFWAPQISTTLTLGLPPKATQGEQVSIMATLMDEDGKPIHGASIDFFIDGVKMASATSDLNGVASTTYTPVKAGLFQVKAMYRGGAKYAESNSSMGILNVEAAPVPMIYTPFIALLFAVVFGVLWIFVYKHKKGRGRLHD